MKLRRILKSFHFRAAAGKSASTRAPGAILHRVKDFNFSKIKTCRRAGFAPLSLRLPVAGIIRSQTGVHFLLTLGLLFVLAVFPACSPRQAPAASTAAAPSQTALAPQPPDTVSPPPTLTVTASPDPTATPTNTRTPQPSATLVIKITPPAGIVYRLKGKLFRTGQAEAVQVEEASGDIPENGVLSPNGAYILVTDLKSQSQIVINRQDGSQVQVWPQNTLNLCPFSWIGGQPSLLLSMLVPDDAHPDYACSWGSPVLLSTENMQLTILDETGSGLSYPAISPDGHIMAFDLGGVPWLLEFGKEPQQLEIHKYGLDSLKAATFENPAWSPSGEYLAWTFKNNYNPAQQGVVIFNTLQQQSSLLMPYEVGGKEGIPPDINFSPDEEYLVFRHFLFEEWDWYSHVISIDGQFSRRLDGYFASWSPQGNLFWMEIRDRWSKCQIYVESPDGSLSIPICYGNWGVWSPDGRQVLTHTYNRDAFWLTDLSTGVTLPLDLPPGAEIVRWEVGE